jgi:hypothetical protein
MVVVIVGIVCFLSGFGLCWISKSRTISFLQHERDELKRSAVNSINRL